MTIVVITVPKRDHSSLMIIITFICMIIINNRDYNHDNAEGHTTATGNTDYKKNKKNKNTLVVSIDVLHYNNDSIIAVPFTMISI